MANYCKIKKPKQVTTNDVGILLKEYFKNKFNFEITYEAERKSETQDSLVLTFKDVKFYMGVFQSNEVDENYVELYDTSQTCFDRSGNENSEYSKIKKLMGSFFYCGYTYSFIFSTVKSVLAKEFDSVIDSDGSGPYDPSKEKIYVLNYSNAISWAMDRHNLELKFKVKYVGIIQKIFSPTNMKKQIREESSHFPEFNKKD